MSTRRAVPPSAVSSFSAPWATSSSSAKQWADPLATRPWFVAIQPSAQPTTSTEQGPVSASHSELPSASLRLAVSSTAQRAALLSPAQGVASKSPSTSAGQCVASAFPPPSAASESTEQGEVFPSPSVGQGAPSAFPSQRVALGLRRYARGHRPCSPTSTCRQSRHQQRSPHSSRRRAMFSATSPDLVLGVPGTVVRVPTGPTPGPVNRMKIPPHLPLGRQLLPGLLLQLFIGWFIQFYDSDVFLFLFVVFSFKTEESFHLNPSFDFPFSRFRFVLLQNS